MPAIVGLPREPLRPVASNIPRRDLSSLTKVHRRGSAFLWAVQHGVVRAAQYAVQSNCDLESGRAYDGTLLDTAIRNRDYAMSRLLIECGHEACHIDLASASAMCCQNIIQQFFISCRDPHWDPDDPTKKAFQEATKLGHTRLAELVSRHDQTDIPIVFRPIWPLLVEAVRSCEAMIPIMGLLLDKMARADQKTRRYHLLHSRKVWCCDVTLELIWGKIGHAR